MLVTVAARGLTRGSLQLERWHRDFESYSRNGCSFLSYVTSPCAGKDLLTDRCFRAVLSHVELRARKLAE